MVNSLCLALLTCVPLLWLVRESAGMPDPARRDLLMREEASRQTGGLLALTAAEQKLDANLHRFKEQEMAATLFLPALHFFKAKPLIEKSAIYRLLQKMPKGAALHIHSSSLVSAEWLVKNVTYRPHCYICFTWDNSVRFLFSTLQPFPRWDCFYWQLLESLRARIEDNAGFDSSLIQHLTLFTENPDGEYPNQDVVWEKFEKAFIAAAGLITHAPVLRDYIYQGLEELHRDNVMYLELRSGLSRTYELDGTIHDKIWTLKMFQEVTSKFKRNYPEFFGARIIISVHRALGISEVRAAVTEAIQLKKDFPDVVAGFDMVGRENSGRTLWYFREALSLPAELGASLPYFFHAGETDDEGTDVDQNILDALLFNTSRIGHGYALAHHPLAKELSRKRKVAVELCPISNQVLKLVSDLRNHPAAVLMSEGHPLVISSDDPALFGSTGLSYDFYEAFVGIGGLKANLGTLKELAANSIRYSSLPDQLKDRAFTLWQNKWDAFISDNS
ncbi:adenosine deaminase CECR1-A isoform X1 [Poecilia reticulata]|uniref:adenosine deaminase CECR1-A isoform X1 n=1 Tax=Poecilia reticulata TaxID=8081 RepID=UPI0004A42AC8|nr:PREDICTED: adenosine deaminase CECR1-A-like isoform X1 [Poecilia reticulata]XP_008398721.1 PREDICTED: adenosine deaminase CECR1-A-like isoform X1 [Poecilia reticulata]XP_008398722.1 PREDICTED: adenosine deaminase CECR1-A-like isoform X1 [Poecilia reticulata]